MCCLSVGEKVVLLQMIMFFSMGARLSFSMYKRLMFICAVSVFVQLTGCKKGDDGMRFSIFTEPFNGGVKVEVNGLESSWRTGDQVWVNGQTGAVAIADNNPVLTMNVSVDSWNGNYYAAYPASVVMNGNQNGELTISLPQIYQYDEDESTQRQLLELPMVATTTNDQIAFKHLTGALIVKVPNTTNRDIVLDYVMVQSSTSALSGTGTVDVDANSPQMIFSADTTHTVIMYFDEHPVTISSGASTTKDIMIPIAPTSGENHQFTVTIRAHTQDSPYLYYLFNGMSTVGNMARNEVGVAPVSSLQENHFVGQGTEANPYLIQNKEDYKHFVRCVTNNIQSVCTAYLKMTNDIFFGGETITTAAGFFRGDFNGEGKTLRNVVVKAQYMSACTAYVLSIFPPVSAGRIRNLNVKDVSFYCQSMNGPVYIGGLTACIKGPESNISFENITVSNIASTTTYNQNTFRVCAGGYVGRIERISGATASYLIMMNNCVYSQQNTRQCIFDVISCGSFSYGGIAGVADGVRIELEGCTVNFDGSASLPGVNLNAHSNPAYVGSIFGALINSTITYQLTLEVKGYLAFSGTNSSNVARLIGYNYLSIPIEGINDSGLFFLKNGTRI